MFLKSPKGASSQSPGLSGVLCRSTLGAGYVSISTLKGLSPDTTYEAAITKAGKNSEIKVAADGSIIK
jgi:hypothetical protein